MIPVRDDKHTKEALAKLTSMFKGRPVIEGLLKSFANRLQTFESAVWDVINSRNLETDNDATLNFLGGIVGEARLVRSNTDYREAIRLRILINRSQGKRAQILKIISMAAGTAYWKHWDAYPAGFRVFFKGTVPAFLALRVALRDAKAAGIGGTLLYSTTNAFLFIPGHTTSYVPDPKFVPRGPASTDGVPFSFPVFIAPLT